MGFPHVSAFAFQTSVPDGVKGHDKWSIAFNSTKSNIFDTMKNVVSPGTVRMTAVHTPEPSTLLLFPGMGLAWFVVFRRKKASKQAADTGNLDNAAMALEEVHG